MFSPSVAVEHIENINYPESEPYNPPVLYPELVQFKFKLDSDNKVYPMIRETFYMLGLDKINFGTEQWNPFGEFINKGAKVIIKPNAVSHLNRADSIFASITHPSILRVVIDYCLIALKGTGTIIIADCPVMSSDFYKWMDIMHIEEVIDCYKTLTAVNFFCFDLRKTHVKWVMGGTPNITRRQVDLDRDGYTMINLKKDSAFNNLSEREIHQIYGADDKTEETIDLHSNGNHIYEVSNTFIDCDVLIYVSKLKVHKKVGITGNIKGMVGIIGNKNSIPHFRRNSPDHGGDEYPDYLPPIQKLLYRYRSFLVTRIRSKHSNFTDMLFLFLDLPRRLIEYVLHPKSVKNKKMLGGGWYGNDTAWRMAVDLIRIALYGKRGNEVLTKEPRHFFSVVDGIIGGEDDGPLSPSSRHAGVILAGFNPVAVDWTAARLINFDPSKIKMLVSARNDSTLSWGETMLPIIHSNENQIETLWENDFCIPFIPPFGWRNHIELFVEKVNSSI